MNRLNHQPTPALRLYPCPDCDGNGTVFVRHPLYGQHNCPFEGDDEPCPNPDCREGFVVLDRHEARQEGYTDPGELIGGEPLFALRRARAHRSLFASSRDTYRGARLRAMQPVVLPKAVRI